MKNSVSVQREKGDPRDWLPLYSCCFHRGVQVGKMNSFTGQVDHLRCPSNLLRFSFLGEIKEDLVQQIPVPWDKNGQHSDSGFFHFWKSPAGCWGHCHLHRRSVISMESHALELY
jgi:hypothetical protein